MIRRPVVAGQFYLASPQRLMTQVEQYIIKDVEKENAVGIVSPHAGFIYSGQVAGAVYSKINIPKKIIILGPNHTGLGSEASIILDGEWEMPNGNIKVDSQLAAKIAEYSEIIEEDYMSHLREHSLEVQLPFIQFFTNEFSIVPICLSIHRLEDCIEIGNSLAKAIKDIEKKVLIVASTDMTHYESHQTAKQKDQMAIDKILELDAEGLYETVRSNRISMCGVIPTVTMLITCKQLGANQANLIKYMTSGDTSGDYSQVVGYAGIIIK